MIAEKIVDIINRFLAGEEIEGVIWNPFIDDEIVIAVTTLTDGETDNAYDVDELIELCDANLIFLYKNNAKAEDIAVMCKDVGVLLRLRAFSGKA